MSTDLSGTSTRTRTVRRFTALAVGSVLALGSLAACSSDDSTSATSVTGTESTGTWGDSSVRTASDVEGTVWDSTSMHTMSVEVDEEELAAMIATYSAEDSKEWLTAAVTIDGQTFEDVGLRLKGNSSLRAVSTDTPAQDVPWLIRLDKFVDGQDLDGSTDFVVRSSTSETSLNEAVALEMLGAAGLATEEAIATRFSVNGSDEALRLVVEDPDDAWDAASFDTEGILYKAQSGGDYSYRGDDPESYTDVFSQKSPSGEDDLTPLVDFLQFLDESDDESFAAELSEHLDVDAFATYLAMQDIVGNFDDIDGPGNNSFLRYDSETGAFTVVSWDLNLAFGQMNGMGGGQPRADMPEGFTPPDGAELPEGFTPPDGAEPPEGVTPPDGAAGGQRPDGGMGGGMGGDNVLVTRFLADEDFAALVDQATADLTSSLVTDGTAQEILDRWTTLLTDEASDLVDPTTIASESESITKALTS
jgi:spore coat protein CotH